MKTQHTRFENVFLIQLLQRDLMHFAAYPNRHKTCYLLSRLSHFDDTSLINIQNLTQFQLNIKFAYRLYYSLS